MDVVVSRVSGVWKSPFNRAGMSLLIKGACCDMPVAAHPYPAVPARARAGPRPAAL